MKVTYLERIENHMAWNSKMFCFSCGAHEYDIVEQLEPKTTTPWSVRCPQCGASSEQWVAKNLAIIDWQGGN